MANTYTWKIPLLEVAPTQDGQTNVVVTIHWAYQGADGLGNTADQTGVTSITYSQEVPFVPFDQLTAETVQGWLTARLDVSAMTADLDQQLALKAPPPALVPMQPPWGG